MVYTLRTLLLTGVYCNYSLQFVCVKSASQYPSQLRGPATPTPDPKSVYPNCQFVSLIPRHPAQHLMQKAQAQRPTAPSLEAQRPHCLVFCCQRREGCGCEIQKQLRLFKMFKRKYVYSASQKTFKPLEAMPAHLPNQILSALDELHGINTAGLLSAWTASGHH